jgi:KDO2-lipid IV(A) lauroyltransferase
MSVGSAVLYYLPDGLRYGLARLGGELSFRLRPGLRRQTLANYAAILGRPTADGVVRKVTRGAMVGYAKLLAEFLMLPRMRPEEIRRRVEIMGFERIQDVLSEGKGAIVVTPHFGNWDMAAAAATNAGLQVTAVTDPFGPGGMNRWVVRARERLGIRVVPISVTAGKASLAALRRNEVVALVCDLPAEGRNVPVRMAGQEAMVPAGPALLSLRTGAPIVPLTCRRVADGYYRLDVQEPVRPIPSSDETHSVAALTQSFIDRFDPILRATPEQWYLFSPMWANVERAPAGQELAATP